MSRRTEKLSKMDRWESLRTRFIAASVLGGGLIAALLLVSENSGEQWENLPLSLAFSVMGALALALCMLFAGMMLRWQTLPRRLTAPLAVFLITAGFAGAVSCILATDNAPRNTLGIAEVRHPGIFIASLSAAVFGAVNWPRRARS